MSFYVIIHEQLAKKKMLLSFVALFESHCGVFYQTVLSRATSSFWGLKKLFTSAVEMSTQQLSQRYEYGSTSEWFMTLGRRCSDPFFIE